jgi:predicted transcriptional regulator with HTH domain
LPLAIAQEISLTTSLAKPLRAFYAASISDFVHADPSFVLGCLSDNSGFSIEISQRDAWRAQITILQYELLTFCRKRLSTL